MQVSQDRLVRFLPASMLPKRRSVIAARLPMSFTPLHVGVGRPQSSAPPSPPTFGDNAASVCPSDQIRATERRRLLPATKKRSPRRDVADRHRHRTLLLLSPRVLLPLSQSRRCIGCEKYAQGESERDGDRARDETVSVSRTYRSRRADPISQTTTCCVGAFNGKERLLFAEIRADTQTTNEARVTDGRGRADGNGRR